MPLESTLPAGARHKLNPPFRADIVGSLLRPSELLDLREAFDGPEFDPIRAKKKTPELIAMEDRLVIDAIAVQEKAGLKSVTDGDFRRRSWFADFMVQLGGICVGWGTDSVLFRSAGGSTRPTPRLNVEGKVRWPEGGITAEDFKYLNARTTATPKITIPTPLQAHTYGGSFDKKVYPEVEAYWDDMINAYHAELRALKAAGCTYVQVDECTLIKICDPRFIELFKSRGEDPMKVKAFYVDILRRLTDGKPEGMTLAMHICRGNSRGHWAIEGEYEPIADVVFTELGFDAYFLEYDTPRAGDFKPLRLVPKGKTIVLGLVTTKSAAMETKDELKRRIDEAAKYVPMDQLCLSPQCGFASSKYGNPVTPDVQDAKLRLVVETAKEVWG